MALLPIRTHKYKCGHFGKGKHAIQSCWSNLKHFQCSFKDVTINKTETCLVDFSTINYILPGNTFYFLCQESTLDTFYFVCFVLKEGDKMVAFLDTEKKVTATQ